MLSDSTLPALRKRRPAITDGPDKASMSEPLPRPMGPCGGQNIIEVPM